MHAVQERLKSTAGATLSVALLFFIMCAAAGSVILAAATTTTGRLSELRATDQNYYAVVSAAKLLRDEIDGQAIAVQQTETKTVTTTREEKTETDADGVKHTVVTETTETKYTYLKPVWMQSQKTTDGTAKITIDGIAFKDVNATDKFFLLDALQNNKVNSDTKQERTGSLTYVNKESGSSLDYMSKTELSKLSVEDSDSQDEEQKKVRDKAFKAFAQKLMNDSEHVYTDTLQISTALGSGITDNLSVDVRIIMNAQGAITAYIKNSSPSDGSAKKGNEYRLMLTLDAGEGTYEMTGTAMPNTSADGNTTTETTTTTRYCYVTWKNPQIMKDTRNDVWTD